nr:unnamed protein product [Digitaria exilis]
MATAAAGSKRGGGRGRKALVAVLDNEANISAGKVAQSGDLSASSAPKAKRAPARSGKAAKASAAAAASLVDDVAELQGMLERLRLEKEKAEEMVRERDEVIRKKEEEIETKEKEQERLQAELRKVQRAKEFKPTVSLPLVKSLLEKDQDVDDKSKKKKGKDKAVPERKKPCTAYVLWLKDQWTEWKALGAEDKQPYEEQYRQEKEAYLQVVGQEKREAEAMKLLEEQQMQWTAKELLDQYLKFRQDAEEGDGKKGKRKNSKKDKDPSKPKQPMSAYFVYSQERRAALVAEKKNVPEIGKITGEEWKNMTQAQKVPYEEVAKKQKEEYLKQMEVYKQKKIEV